MEHKLRMSVFEELSSLYKQNFRLFAISLPKCHSCCQNVKLKIVLKIFQKKTKFEKLSFHALQVVVYNVPATDGLNQTIRVTL